VIAPSRDGVRTDPYSFAALRRHWHQCRRSKRCTLNALRFELDAEANLLDLQRELREHTYTPGTSMCFVTDGPKPREVFAADFRDRIVHHLLVAQVEPLFERRFIHDSFACRKGKGTLAASDRLTAFLRSTTRNGRRRVYALKLDVASFFPSIDKQVLCDILERAVRDPELRWLTRTVLFHDPTRDYRFQPRGPRGLHRRPRPGPRSVHYPVPEVKSLFGKANRLGLPIGNLTSQFWANVYLNELDQFVKRTLRVRHYVRYVDDMVLLSEDPAELERWHAAIEGFLAERLHLRLRADRARPRLVACGVDFAGWRTWWSHRLPRRRTLAALDARVAAFARAALRRQDSRRGGADFRVDVQAPALRARRAGADAGQSPATAAGELYASLASYAGHLRHGAAVRAWQRAWRRRPWLDALLERRGFAVRERFPRVAIERARGFRRRYWATVRRAGARCLVFFPVGGFVEFRGPQRLLAERVLGLRTARIPRGGFALTCGFPRRLAPCFRERALESGIAVAEVGRLGRAGGTLSIVAWSGVFRARSSSSWPICSGQDSSSWLEGRARIESSDTRKFRAR